MQETNTTKPNKQPYLLHVLLDTFVRYYILLKNYWKLLFVATCIGVLGGTTYWIIKKDTYTARTSFMVEDTKSSNSGLASAVAGQLGFDIGSLGASSGLLQGDNILQLLKSNSLIKKALLTAFDSSQKKSLADVYADSYGLIEKWENNKKIGQRISFPTHTTVFSRLEDSLLYSIIKRIEEKELTVIKPDKKLGLFELQITTRNELLSKMICERLLQVTSEFYINTKTTRIRGNIDRLQHRVDSIQALLNHKTFKAIESNRQLLDLNPAYAQSGEMNAEISARDKIVQSTIFAELTKSLETSKTSLLQETPTIQVVDNPELPLKKNEVILLECLLLGALIGMASTAFLILFIKS
jgi:hypothetical protein